MLWYKALMNAFLSVSDDDDINATMEEFVMNATILTFWCTQLVMKWNIRRTRRPPVHSA